MKPFTTTIDIARPIDEVFTFLTDLDNATAWSTELVEVRHDGPLRQGATGVDVRRMGRRTLEVPWAVTGWDAPNEVVFEFGAPFNATSAFGFERLGPDRTRVSCRTKLRLKGWWRLLAPMIRIEGKRTDEAQFRTVRDLLEERAASRGT